MPLSQSTWSHRGTNGGQGGTLVGWCSVSFSQDPCHWGSLLGLLRTELQAARAVPHASSEA